MKKTRTEITTMCCVFNKETQEMLFIERKYNWLGLAFPGGHLENGESITDCIKREIKEETNLTIQELSFKGIANFYNTNTQERLIVFNYFADVFDGKCFTESKEGNLSWIKVSEINNFELAEGMMYRIPLFLQEGIFEYYVEWCPERGYTKVNKIKL